MSQDRKLMLKIKRVCGFPEQVSEELDKSSLQKAMMKKFTKITIS